MIKKEVLTNQVRNQIGNPKIKINDEKGTDLQHKPRKSQWTKKIILEVKK